MALFFFSLFEGRLVVISTDRSKFNVDKDKEKRTCDGIVFDSATEMKYYRDVLCPLVESGDVIHYELQKEYELQPGFIRNGKKILPINYVADFYMEYADGHSEVIDVKGCPDNIAKLKRKLFWYKYPETIYLWVCYSKIDGGWILYEDVQAARKLRKKLKKEKQNGKQE